MTKKDFLEMGDLDAPQVGRVLDVAAKLKGGEYAPTPLAGQALAMIFTKSSTRTRVSFEVGMFQLGGHALFLSSRDIQLGRGEPIMDTARVLSGYVDGIMIRTFDHADVQQLAEHASIPVINGLTDLLHPCQILSDLLTVREHLGSWEGRVFTWIGDGNNMANSWLNAAALLGFELRLACPEGFTPDAQIFERAATAAPVSMTRDPMEAALARMSSTPTSGRPWGKKPKPMPARSRSRATRSMRISWPGLRTMPSFSTVCQHIGVKR